MAKLSARIQLNGLTEDGWNDLATLAAASGVTRSEYVRRVLTAVLLKSYTLWPDAPREKTRKQYGVMPTNLAVRIPPYLAEQLDRKKGGPFRSRMHITYAAVAFALRYKVWFVGNEAQFNFKIERTKTYDPGEQS